MELSLKRETFVTNYPPYSVMQTKHVASIWERRPVNVYVHLPFCPKRCHYCYYRVEEYKGKDPISKYVEHLLKEIELLAERPEIQTCSMQTLYFGGGTPTMLSAEQFVQIVEALERVFPKTHDYQFNVEVRPGAEATQEKLNTLKQLGVHRISLGVQSMNDTILTANGRNHKTETFYKTYERIRNAGFDWVNCDLMSGMLHETDDTWKYSLELLKECNPENITIYKMEVFFNTKLFSAVRRNPEILISHETEAKHFRWARNFLEGNGYFMCNNATFATDDKYIDRHRQNVQYGGDMVGIGLSSHSYFQGNMYQNTSDMKEYQEVVAGGKLPISRSYKLSQKDQITRHVVMSLKNLKVSRSQFVDNFGFDLTQVFPDEVRRLTSEGFAHLDNEHLSIDPEYYDFADDVARLFYPMELHNDMLAHISRKE